MDNIENNNTRPREIKPSVKRLIYYRAVTQRMVPREFLANELIKEIKGLGEIAPKLETAKRYISKARNADNPLDKPWSIACCSQYSSIFSPKSISEIMDYKQWIYHRFKDKEGEYTGLFGSSVSDISIRHAMWIVRLKPLIDKTFAELIENDENVRFGYPFTIAIIYSMAEKTCEILDEHFVSFGLDNALAAGDLNTLARIAGLSILATSRPITCDNNCESCKYIKLPGFNKFCIPSQKKEGEK